MSTQSIEQAMRREQWEDGKRRQGDERMGGKRLGGGDNRGSHTGCGWFPNNRIFFHTKHPRSCSLLSQPSVWPERHMLAASMYHLLVKLSQLQSLSLLPWQLQLLQSSSLSLEERGRGVKYCCTVGVHAARLRTERVYVRRKRNTLKCIAMDVQ